MRAWCFVFVYNIGAPAHRVGAGFAVYRDRCGGAGVARPTPPGKGRSAGLAFDDGL